MDSSCEKTKNAVPRIIFGAETEYGIFILDQESGTPYDANSFVVGDTIECMLDEASRVFPDAFDGVHGGIEDKAEHKMAERMRLLLNRFASLQRRGFTGLMLPNGARFYRDMTHPEFAIPEVNNPKDGVAHQRAGDRIVELCRRSAEASLQEEMKNRNLAVRIDKNNSDGHGKSYAAHENYALRPEIFLRVYRAMSFLLRSKKNKNLCFSTDSTTEAITLFFVARQIIIGAGKCGSESGESVPYQISQRADFIVQRASHDTTEGRGIINLRDIPYADPKIARRFHVIVGDSNISDISLYLKFGITALFFMMANDGFWERDSGIFTVPLKNPVGAFHEVSRDLSLRKKQQFINGRAFSALEIMQEFALLASRFVREKQLGKEWHDVITRFSTVLAGLDTARHANELSRSLDWVVKERVLLGHQKKKGVEPLDWSCRFLALEYHNINPGESIFAKLCAIGEVVTLVDEDAVRNAMHSPPETTRAWLRSEIIRRYRAHLHYVSWGAIITNADIGIQLPSPYCGVENFMETLFLGDPPWEEFLNRASRANSSHIVIVREQVEQPMRPNGEKK